VVGDKLDYHFKYEDRSRMNALKSTHCTLAGEDILILQDGFVTDTSFCNVVFENRRGLFTPSTPLLHGTKRQYLLDTGRIQACLIRESEILQYENVYLINAMIDLQDRVMVPLRR
ncbi:MAG: aminotransferase class IV, partial [Bacteroidaceae bacterium]